MAVPVVTISLDTDLSDFLDRLPAKLRVNVISIGAFFAMTPMRSKMKQFIRSGTHSETSGETSDGRLRDKLTAAPIKIRRKAYEKKGVVYIITGYSTSRQFSHYKLIEKGRKSSPPAKGSQFGHKPQAVASRIKQRYDLDLLDPMMRMLAQGQSSFAHPGYKARNFTKRAFKATRHMVLGRFVTKMQTQIPKEIEKVSKKHVKKVLTKLHPGFKFKVVKAKP